MAVAQQAEPEEQVHESPSPEVQVTLAALPRIDRNSMGDTFLTIWIGSVVVSVADFETTDATSDGLLFAEVGKVRQRLIRRAKPTHWILIVSPVHRLAKQSQ